MTRLILTHRYSRTVELQTPDLTASIDAGEVQPGLPFSDNSITSIDALDILEHVTDEEAWLEECARVLIPGGSIRIQVPRQGATSWFESLNIYRYAVDVLNRGHDPREIKLTGWHRQYTVTDLRTMLEYTGFLVNDVRLHSLGLAEIPTLGRLIVGDLIRNDRATGKRVKDARTRLDLLDSRIPAGPLSRRLLVTARRT
jgi:hypothetical protein